MNLAPLADVVAYIDCDPSQLAGVRGSLQGRFDTVWSPVDGCVMATRALPRSVPDGEDLRAAGFAFAEGRDTVADRPVAGLVVESLPGGVGFVQATGNRLVVVRSGPGTVPWYAWQDGERALVTTTFTELVRLLPVSLELDPLVCALWASFEAMFPDGRSFLRGVTAIASGHTAEVGPGHPARCRPWWDPWPDELPWPSRAATADHVERFREAVLRALDREVAYEPVNLLTLSGGVDSSALAYLAARQMGRPLAALSFVPPQEGPRARLESSYLDPLVADLGIAQHVRLPLDGRQRLALVAGAPPVAFPVLHPALQMLARLVREGSVDVLLGGEWADEVCGGWFAYPDWLDAVPPLGLLRRAARLPKGRSDVKAWVRRRVPGRPLAGPWAGSLAEWVQPEVEDEYQSWRAGQLASLRALASPHRYQRAVLARLNGVQAMNWEVCSFLRVRRAFPFLTADVLEVIAACHPVELLGPGPKRLERQAFDGLVPDRYLRRPDKGGWGEADDTLVDPQEVPASLAVALREDLGRMAPSSAAGIAIASRFTQDLAALAKGRLL